MIKVIAREIPQIANKLHDHPVLHNVYAARGVVSPVELEYGLKNLLSYESLKDIKPAVDCLVQALEEQQHILVLGDFDADGATSTALTILALKSFGLKNVTYLIPNRFEYGYGLSPEIVAVAAKSKPDVILTVDNGIASIEGVAAANNLGIKVLITDHHLAGNRLPEAAAIVNPNQPDDEFPSKNLAGVGVVFYLMLALRARLRDLDWFSKKNITEPNMVQFLDLVALGTVADSVVLDHNNRLLVSQGLNRIRLGKCCLGIKALLSIAKRNYEKASIYDFGFVVAPRINAAGRLDDMSIGVECLLADDVECSRSLAKKLDVLNNERREIAQDMQRQASRLIEELQLEKNLPYGLCVFEESWHQGVVGILASRLKDKLHRPVIVFASSDDNEIKGSARSVENVHIREVLNSIAIKNPGLINKFGGHAMAAGLSLSRKNYEFFAQEFDAQVYKLVSSSGLGEVIYTDGELLPEYVSIEVADLINSVGPWGAGFSEPLFIGKFTLVEQTIVGKKHLRMVVRSLESKQEVNAIYFNVNTDAWPNLNCSKAEMVYRMSVNEYNGRRSLQLLITEIINYE